MATSENGNKSIVLNTRERVLSTDANRAQTFYGASIADLLRFMLDAETEESRFGGSTEVMSDGTEVPPRAYIVNGIRPFPVNGTNSLLISPGVMALVDNPADPNVDNSVGAWIVDPGIQTVGTLTLPANGSGLTIIGVVECQRATVVTEQDNRDIFNVVTGLFSPVLVNKVTTGRLTYRIRMGVAGAGFPGVVAGWIPLMVFNSPNGAVTWDDVLLMWDVRNLINDRWNAPFNTSLSRSSELTRCEVITDLQVVGQSRVYGEILTNRNEARAGGVLGLDSPSAAAVGFFDLLLAANQTGNFAGFAVSNFWHLYAIFPFGLPRWQKYSTVASPSPRRPVGPRGILAIAEVGPRFDGVPSANVTAPTATGLLDPAAQNAIVLASGKTSAVPAPLPITGDGHVVWCANDVSVPFAPTAQVLPTYDEFTFTDNVTHPGNARAIYVRFAGSFTISAPDRLFFNNRVIVANPDGPVLVLSETFYGTGGTAEIVSNPPLEHQSFFVARISLPPGITISAARVFKVRWQYTAAAFGAAVVTVVTTTANVIGWEPGP